MFRYFEINEEGHNIRCKIYCQDMKNITRAVIFGHGFGGHKDNGAAERFSQWLLNKHKGVALITFNWPCHGDDVKKKLCLADCDAYLRLVTDYAREKLQCRELYAYATSFGGYLTLKYIHENTSPFRRTALRCPAIPMYQVLSSAIMTDEDREKLARGKDVSVGFDRKIPVSPQFLEELRQKDIRTWDYIDYAEDILILHGTADEIVPFDQSRAFADEQLMEFVPIEGADHRFRDPKKMDQAIKAILEFFAL